MRYNSYESCKERYECRKIFSSEQEHISFVKKIEEENCSRILRFQIGARPAYDKCY